MVLRRIYVEYVPASPESGKNLKKIFAETNHIEEGGRVTVTCNATEVKIESKQSQEWKALDLKGCYRGTLPWSGQLGKLVYMAADVVHFWL